LDGVSGDLGRAEPSVDPTVERRRRTALAVALIWDEKRDVVLGQVGVLENAVAALSDGVLGDDLRGAARSEAHKLAGSAGTFGFSRSSGMAREMELIFREGRALGEGDQLRLSELCAGLRTELSGRPPTVPDH
jgi:hypothetical protein